MRGFSLHRLLERVRVTSAPVRSRDGSSTSARYPGAVSDAHGRIAGEVYEIGAPALWTVLDSAEGPQYHRGEVGVRMDDGAERVAFIYWYRGPLRGVPIPGGDYRAHAPARSIHHDPRV